MCASAYGQTDTAQVLLEGGAAVNIKSNVRMIDMIFVTNHLLTDVVLLCSMERLLFGGHVMEITQTL